MSVVARNIKLIRKALNCNQTAMAQILGTGFRTYVRYEAGERDVPASLLVKLAHLGNISLDQLLTTELTPTDIQLQNPENKPRELPVVLSGSIEEGRILLKGHLEDILISTSSEENRLLDHFRKMSTGDRKKCLKKLEQSLQTLSGETSPVPTKSAKKKRAARIKKVARSVKKTTLR